MIKKSFKTFLYLIATFLVLSQFAYALNIVELSPGYYPNSSRGSALSSADIYVGKPDLDPEIVANQKTLSVQQEDGTIVAVSQPIHTSAGGVPQYAGSPVTLLVEGDYSLKVLDSNGSQIYYVPSTAYDQYLIAGNYYYPDYAEADQGVVGGGNSVTDILAEVGVTENATIYFSHNSGGNTTTYTFTTNTTITDNFNIIIEDGAVLDGAGILTENGFFPFILYQVFGPSITVAFGSGSTDRLIPNWWATNTTPGTTDMTTAVQAAITASYSSRIPVSYLAETYYVDTLTYKGESMYGVPGATPYSASVSVLKGKDSKDVLQYPDLSTSPTFLIGTIIKDLTIIVDDSTDASGSFNRNGVGNAGLAMPMANGADCGNTYYLLKATLYNVSFYASSLTSGGQNKSCGIYQQGVMYGTNLEYCSFYRFAYGFWGDYPTSNETSCVYAPDCNRFTNNVFNWCGESFRMYNSHTSAIDGIQIYTVSGGKGIFLNQFTSSTRSTTTYWSVDNMFLEDHANTTGELSQIEGYGHIFSNVHLKASNSAAYISWDADSCLTDGAVINHDLGTDLATIKIDGNRNRFISVKAGDFNNDWVEDNGYGNIIEIDRTSNVTLRTSRPVATTISRNQMAALSRNSDFLSAPNTPYYSNEDLFIWPSDIHWTNPATQPTITKDSTITETGEYVTIPSTGGGYFDKLNYDTIKLGYRVPEGKVKFLIKARMGSSATTQAWSIKVNNVTIDSDTLSFATTWSVQSFIADLSGLTKGHTVLIMGGDPIVNQAVEIAWIAIVPFEEEELNANIGTGWGVYDFDADGGAIGSYVLGQLFDNAVITRAWYETITDPTSGGAATIAIGVATNDANGIITATAFDNAIFDPGYHDGTPDGTATNFTTQTTAIRDVQLAIAGAALTAGKIKVWWEYVVGE